MSLLSIISYFSPYNFCLKYDQDSSHSSQAAIHRLPFELLSKIFVLHLSLEANSSQEQDKPPLGGLLVSHICAYWRSVSLGTPVLWTNIDSRRHAALNQLFLERSRDRTLTVSVGIDCDTKFCGLLTKDISRVCEFRTTEHRNKHPTSITDAFRMLLSRSSSVESVAITCHFMSRPSHFTDKPIVDFALLPNLKILHLECFTALPMALSEPTALTHLTLRCNMTNKRLFVSNVLGFLICCPLLEVLYIDCTYIADRTVQQVDYTRAKVRLPRLKRLAIHASPESIFQALLIGLIFPADTLIYLRDSEIENRSQGICSLFPPSAHSGHLEFLRNITTIRLHEPRREDGHPFVFSGGNNVSAFSVCFDATHFVLLHPSLLPLSRELAVSQIRERVQIMCYWQ